MSNLRRSYIYTVLHQHVYVTSLVFGLKITHTYLPTPSFQFMSRIEHFIRVLIRLRNNLMIPFYLVKIALKFTKPIVLHYLSNKCMIIIK